MPDSKDGVLLADIINNIEIVIGFTKEHDFASFSADNERYQTPGQALDPNPFTKPTLGASPGEFLRLNYNLSDHV